MVAISPQKIEGNWKSGIALDFHTTSSTPIGPNQFGHMQFETVRPEIAELLYRLKYKHEQTAAQGIISAAATFLKPHRANLPVGDCVTTTRPTTQLKGVTDPEKRKELVDGLYAVDSRHTKGRNILLFDDLFRSGSTMNAITDVLLRQGQAASVRVLTITRTRSNQ